MDDNLYLLILITDRQNVKIGEIYQNQGVYDRDGRWRENVTFKVIREATREEYVAQVLDSPRPHNGYSKYYAVSLD